eukprot:5145646-Amphidinium_carterae.1
MGNDLRGLGEEYADHQDLLFVQAEDDSDDRQSSEDSDDYERDYDMSPWMEHHFTLAQHEIDLSSHTMMFADLAEHQAFMQ